jgi:septum formation protein
VVPSFYLASRSPRRQELLAGLGYAFSVCAADIDETPGIGEDPRAFARRMATSKAQVGARQIGAEALVLAADTDVAIDGEILGKPRDEAHAVEMLMRLSGATHWVHSAVAVALGERLEVVETATRIHFASLTPAQARAYWATGEPRDKAGAYALQGHAARWVRAIEGSHTGVIGLPLHETVTLLAGFGVLPPGDAA